MKPTPTIMDYYYSRYLFDLKQNPIRPPKIQKIRRRSWTRSKKIKTSSIGFRKIRGIKKNRRSLKTQSRSRIWGIHSTKITTAKTNGNGIRKGKTHQITTISWPIKNARILKTLSHHQRRISRQTKSHFISLIKKKSRNSWSFKKSLALSTNETSRRTQPIKYQGPIRTVGTTKTLSLIKSHRYRNWNHLRSKISKKENLIVGTLRTWPKNIQS